VSRVSKAIGITQLTHRLILLYLATVGRPARTSEVRAAVVKYSPESASPLYGCLGDLQAAGLVKRITMERDALLTIGELRSV
jgi:hypothetical protein